MDLHRLLHLLIDLCLVDGDYRIIEGLRVDLKVWHFDRRDLDLHWLYLYQLLLLRFQLGGHVLLRLPHLPRDIAVDPVSVEIRRFVGVIVPIFIVLAFLR